MKRGSRTPLSYFDRDREADLDVDRDRDVDLDVDRDVDRGRAGVIARAAADTASSAHGCIDSASSSALSGGVQ